MISDVTEMEKSTWVEKGLARLPVISSYVQQRGTAFVISYVHRITGIFIVGFIGFHFVEQKKCQRQYEAR